MTQIFVAGWNIDDVISWIQNHCPLTFQDSERQILIYSGLYEWSDGTLHDVPEIQYV